MDNLIQDLLDYSRLRRQELPLGPVSVRQALEHIMTGDALILSRLERWPDDGFATLQSIHRVAFQRFTVMEPDDTQGTRTVLGRPQTVRRVMRRLLEHELEHYHHIEEIIAALGEGPAGS